MTLTLHLVRHAPTRPNAERRYPRPQEDAELSAEGQALARTLRLPAAALAFSSPSLRARETAALAGFPHATPTPALSEANFGVMAGRTWAELEAAFGDAPRRWIDALADPASGGGPPEGETGREFHARVQAWLSALPESGEAAAFTHAGPLQAALHLSVGLRAAETPPGTVATLRRARGQWWLVGLAPPAPAPPSGQAGTRVVFVTGGARSGKSAFAEGRAAQPGGGVTCLATAQGLDDEMAARIERHRADRPPGWLTVEEPLEVPAALLAAATPTALLDCLSLWVSNLLLAGATEGAILARTDTLLSAARARPGLTVLVTNEVGCGVVPDNALARRYRDVLGRVNQKAAAASDEAWLLSSGLPLRLKPTS